MMVTKKTGKSKGSQFEMNCRYSLFKVMPSIIRLGSEGFQLQYDLESDTSVFECKRLKGMSWNQAVKFFIKLETKSPFGKKPYLLFKSNRQPCLVMYKDDKSQITVKRFEDVFNVMFEKHPSTRKTKTL